MLNGNFDHKLSKLIDICLAINKVPKIDFVDIKKYLDDEKRESLNTPSFLEVYYDHSFHFVNSSSFLNKNHGIEGLSVLSRKTDKHLLSQHVRQFCVNEESQTYRKFGKDQLV